jgi:hypothetical protein
MNKATTSITFLLAVAMLPGTLAIGRNKQQDPQQQPADNTKTNQRVRDSSSPTADQQNEHRRSGNNQENQGSYSTGQVDFRLCTQY